MKNETTQSPEPIFDRAAARPVPTPFPHCETRRTIYFAQPLPGADDQENVALFSATFQFIGTCSAEEFNAAAKAAAPLAASAEPAPQETTAGAAS